MNPSGLLVVALMALLAVVAAPAARGASASPTHVLGDDAVRARLILAGRMISPGGTLGAVIELTPAAGWHLYGPGRGDAGAPPEVAWTLPRGLRAGAIGFPPARRVVTRGLITFDYDGRTALRVALGAVAGAPQRRDARIVAHVTWYACGKVCVPGHADLATTLDVEK